MTQALRCQCGKLRGQISRPELGLRAVCYCKDCQMFAKYLVKSAEVLDEDGGTDVVGIEPRHLSFTEGVEHLACLSLTDKGLLRWYASCCKTPIANTPRNFKIAHAGVIHACLDSGPQSMSQTFGPVRLRVNTKGAKGKIEPSKHTFGIIGRHLVALVRRRVNGDFRLTPFFNIDNGAPISQPRVLDRDEWAHLRRSL
jgi:hypothetical protein